MKKCNAAIIDYFIITVLLGIVAAMLYVFAIANIFHYTAHIEADIASESLLTEVIYTNGYVQPDTWCASTTRRIISVPNFAAFIYPFVGYDSNLATGITCTFMMVIMLALLLWFLRKIGIDLIASLTALIVLFSVTSPADESQRMVFLYASYYVSHVITMLIVLMIYKSFIENDRVKLLPLLLSFVIAMLNGMQGLHAFMFCYFPIIIIEIVRRLACLISRSKQPDYGVLFWALAVNAITLLTTKLTSANNVGTSRNIRHALEKFVQEVCPTIYKTLPFERMPIMATLFVIVAVVGYVIAFRTIIKKDMQKARYWSALCFLVGFLVCVLLTTFTTFDVAGRYYLMIIYAISIGVAFIMSHTRRIVRYFVIGIAIVSSIISIKDFYNNLIIGDYSKNSSYYAISKWMEDKKYSYGYSTFDFSNPITVMNNNGVKVRAVTNMKDLEGLKWLSDSSWYPPIKSSDGETCYIVSAARKDEFNAFLETQKPIIICTHEIDDFMIYVLNQDYTEW